MQESLKCINIMFRWHFQTVKPRTFVLSLNCDQFDSMDIGSITDLKVKSPTLQLPTQHTELSDCVKMFCYISHLLPVLACRIKPNALILWNQWYIVLFCSSFLHWMFYEVAKFSNRKLQCYKSFSSAGNIMLFLQSLDKTQTFFLLLKYWQINIKKVVVADAILL